jgi:CopG family nickel-responsive transcriptional regulator
MQRFTISLQNELAQQFDTWIAQRGYETRSEAVRDMLRAELERNQQQAAQSLHCVANLSYVYRFGQRELVERLARLQHDHHDVVVSTMHMQLDHEYRLETVMLRGATTIVSTLADAICAERGVHHGHLNLVSVTEHLSHVHPHQEAHDHAHHHAHHEVHPEVHPESHHQVHRHIHFKPTH